MHVLDKVDNVKNWCVLKNCFKKWINSSFLLLNKCFKNPSDEIRTYYCSKNEDSNQVTDDCK